MATATRLIYSGKVRVDGMLDRRFRFDQAPEAYEWLDHNPQGAVKVALVYE